MVFMVAALVAAHTLELASAGLSGGVRIVTGAVAGFWDRHVRRDHGCARG